MSSDTAQIRSLEFRVKMLEGFAYSNGKEELVRQVNHLAVQLERAQKELKNANAAIQVLKSFFGETQFEEALQGLNQEEARVPTIDVLESNQEGLWGVIKTSLSLKIAKPSFDTWFEKTKEIDFDGSTLTVGVVNDFSGEWLESRYSSCIKQIAREVTGQEITFKFVIIEREVSPKCSDD